jgi:hypothetical protein
MQILIENSSNRNVINLILNFHSGLIFSLNYKSIKTFALIFCQTKTCFYYECFRVPRNRDRKNEQLKLLVAWLVYYTFLFAAAVVAGDK